MKSNVLISGINGFVGSNLKPYLLKEYNVIGLSRNPKSIEDINIGSVSINDFNNVYAFVHLAGKAHDLKNISEEKEYYDINTKLTIKLFDLFLSSNCEIFIFISTVKAVADHVDSILTEDTIPNPITAYGKSKLKAEEYLLSKKLPKNKRVFILRPCMIHGPNNKGNLNLLYKILNKNIPFPLGRFENKRSFLSIDNLCYIIKKLIEKKPVSDVYNIADDEVLSINELAKEIGDIIGKPTKILKIPKLVIRLMALIGEILPLPLNEDRLDKLTENYCVSNLKIKKALGVELPFSARQGLSKTINSFKEEK